VRQPVTPTLRREAEAFALRFACDDCCHRDDSSGAPTCTLGFPAELRRDALDGDELAFCKSFELA
jgi:hypothetical protein